MEISREALLQLAEQGMTQRDIAAQLGVSASAISQRLKRIRESMAEEDAARIRLERRADEGVAGDGPSLTTWCRHLGAEIGAGECVEVIICLGDDAAAGCACCEMRRNLEGEEDMAMAKWDVCLNPSCLRAGQNVKIIAAGLCWTCYGNKRRGLYTPQMLDEWRAAREAARKDAGEAQEGLGADLLRDEQAAGQRADAESSGEAPGEDAAQAPGETLGDVAAEALGEEAAVAALSAEAAGDEPQGLERADASAGPGESGDADSDADGEADQFARLEFVPHALLPGAQPQPVLCVDKHGSIRFNAAAVARMGEPERLEVLVALAGPGRMALGFRAAQGSAGYALSASNGKCARRTRISCNHVVTTHRLAACRDVPVTWSERNGLWCAMVPAGG